MDLADHSKERYSEQQLEEAGHIASTDRRQRKTNLSKQ